MPMQTLGGLCIGSTPPGRIVWYTATPTKLLITRWVQGTGMC
jgi:hypothetical protein